MEGMSANHHELMYDRQGEGTAQHKSMVIPPVVYPLWSRAKMSNNDRAVLLLFWGWGSSLEDCHVQ